MTVEIAAKTSVILVTGVTLNHASAVYLAADLCNDLEGASADDGSSVEGD